MSETNEPQLPPREGGTRRTALIAGAAALAVVVATAVAFAVTRGGDDDRTTASAGGDPKTVSIGVTDASQPYWKTYADLAKERFDVDVKLVNFGDYSQPNPALKQKQLDINQFQHIQYLADYNVKADDDLQPIGSTAVYPLPLYSTKYRDASDIPARAKVAIPNDAINEARGLLVLQAAKLVTLKDGGTPFSSAEDVVSGTVEVVPLDASQTAGALKAGSVAAAVVNNNYATDAKLPRTDVVFQDDPESPSAAPYVNVFAVRAADKDDATYLDLAKLYQDPAVQQEVQAANGGAAVLRNVPAAQLQSELATVEQQARAAGA